MQNLDKNFRHLSRKEKLQQLVDKQWLSEEQFDILLNHPLIDEEVANSLIENVIRKVHYPLDYYRISLWTIRHMLYL
ncbi:3-hydroxy-3-methylglutaryl-coenzyme A reductase [Staphylococcus aureus]|nr:3-hydroxy-3-methylglutaryl-coenzyme A reductase [Staphylococcus aureus]